MISSIILAIAFVATLLYHYKAEERWAQEREALIVLAKAQTHHEARDFSKAVERVKSKRDPKAEDPDRPRSPTKTIGL